MLIVAHSTLIRLTLCLALGIDLAAYRSAMPRLDRATLTEIRVDAEGHIGLVRYNAPIVWLGEATDPGPAARGCDVSPAASAMCR